jgi:hypothetical protein
MPSYRVNQALLQATDKFARLLDGRFHRGVATSERAVLFTFCYALIESLGFRPEEMILEARHEAIKGAIDLLISPFNDATRCAVECKYDKHKLKRDYSEYNQRAGKKFKDIFRLALLYSPTMETLFVYLTDRQMANYFRDKKNLMDDFFDLKEGNTCKVDDSNLPQNNYFRSNAGPITPCMVTMLLSRSLFDEHELRVYRVYT